MSPIMYLSLYDDDDHTEFIRMKYEKLLNHHRYKKTRSKSYGSIKMFAE